MKQTPTRIPNVCLRLRGMARDQSLRHMSSANREVMTTFATLSNTADWLVPVTALPLSSTWTWHRFAISKPVAYRVSQHCFASSKQRPTSQVAPLLYTCNATPSSMRQMLPSRYHDRRFCLHSWFPVNAKQQALSALGSWAWDERATAAQQSSHPGVLSQGPGAKRMLPVWGALEVYPNMNHPLA